MGDSVFEQWARRELIWLPRRGLGYMPITQDNAVAYGEAYFARYRALDATPLAAALTKARIDLVARHWAGSLLDVGIGGGLFVQTRQNTTGWDVNPRAVDWLNEEDLLDDPWMRRPAMSFWDSLEHIPDPEPLLMLARQWIFVSLPIFRNGDHALASKHYKPGEHCWYFTEHGFEDWARAQGFEIAERSAMESDLGREGIVSFALRRAGERHDRADEPEEAT